MMEKVKIKCNQWNNYIDEFLVENKGRLTQIESKSDGKIKRKTEFEMPLQDITICTFETGDLITIALGDKQIEITCSIDSPVEIWETYNYEGQAMAAEFITRKPEKILISFSGYL